jgi:hypothetical protein
VHYLKQVEIKSYHAQGNFEEQKKEESESERSKVSAPRQE